MLAESASKIEANADITVEDFEASFGDKLSDRVHRLITGRNFRHSLLRGFWERQWINHIQYVIERDIPAAGRERHFKWESGWSENLADAKRIFGREALIPRYFGKNAISRWRQCLILPESKTFEYDIYCTMQEWLFEKYFTGADEVYEFGCGTGHNLFRIRDVNPHATLYGLDWAESSQSLVTMMAEITGSKMVGLPFDFFRPHLSKPFSENAAVLTCAALEQVGTEYGAFIDFLVEKRPRIVLHIEPVVELLDPSNELDALSIAYAAKRNYLRGLLGYLRTHPRIEVLDARRTGVGSLYLDGYQVVAWGIKK